MVYIIVGIVVFLIIAGIVVLKYLKLREIDNNINVVTSNIMDLLDEKEKVIKLLLDNIKDDKIKNLYKEDNLELFEKEDMLFDVSWNINKYYLDNKKTKDVSNNLSKINDVEDSIEGLKDYYNMNAINYNEIYSKIPFMYIFKLFKLNNKKVFKLRKLECYEILKD